MRDMVQSLTYCVYNKYVTMNVCLEVLSESYHDLLDVRGSVENIIPK